MVLASRLRWPFGAARERPAPAPADPPAAGDVDARYGVKSLLGRGGTSMVFLAEQRSMARPVALKVLDARLVGNETARKRFLREVRAVSRLRSPHTISIFDVGTSPEGIPWIAMELLQGKSLYEVQCESPGPMAVHRAAGLVDQALDSLAEAHGAGVLHRDLKPENLFLLPGQTGEEFLKVLDFGIAQLQDDGPGRETEVGMVVGTPRYMSPEQASGKPLDARSDLYSLALILYELLAGRFPFEAPTPVAVALRKLTQDPPALRDLEPRARVPAPLEAFLHRALSRDPDHRPADATAFRKALHEALEASAAAPEPAAPDPADLPPPLPPPPPPVAEAPRPLPRAASRAQRRPHAPAAAPRVPEAPAAATPPAAPGTPRDRRGQDRERRLLSFRYRWEGRPCRATTLDISPGGAFLFSRDLPARGARLRLSCPDPSGQGTLLLVAEVVRLSDPAPDAGQVQGFAVRWVLPEGAEPPATVDALLARHRARGTAPSAPAGAARPAA